VCAVVTVIFRVYNSVSVIITVLKSIAKKRVLKTEDFYVCCG
jgi:glycopeptide antibiotics resistance protein